MGVSPHASSEMTQKRVSSQMPHLGQREAPEWFLAAKPSWEKQVGSKAHGSKVYTCVQVSAMRNARQYLGSGNGH